MSMHSSWARCAARTPDVAVLFQILLRRLVWAVNGVERQVEEERFAAVVGFDEAGGLSGHQERRIAVLNNGAAIAVPVQDRAPHVREGIDRGGVVAVVVVKAPLQRQVGALPFAEVPLAHHPSAIACLAQGLGDGALVEEHAVPRLRCRPDLHSVLPGITPRHQAGPCGGADGLYVELRQLHALSSNPVNVRRRHLPPPVEADLFPAHVVREKHHEVRARRQLCRGGYDCHEGE